MTDENFSRAARLTDIESAFPLAVTLDDGTRLCLVRDGDAAFAVLDRCPHRDFALSSGDVVDACILECPWHGARFDVRTGAVVQGPATDALETFAVRVVDGEVYVGPRHAVARTNQPGDSVDLNGELA